MDRSCSLEQRALEHRCGEVFPCAKNVSSTCWSRGPAMCASASAMCSCISRAGRQTQSEEAVCASVAHTTPSIRPSPPISDSRHMPMPLVTVSNDPISAHRAPLRRRFVTPELWCMPHNPHRPSKLNFMCSLPLKETTSPLKDSER